MNRIVSFLAIFLISAVYSYAQEFKYILEDDLSSKLISDIFQDRDGMIWITTDNGLNRFDGNKVRSYIHDDADSLSLCHNLLYSVSEDSRGNIYIGNYLGIQIYNKNTDSFSPKAIHTDGRAFEETVYGFCELPDGTMCSFGDNAWKVLINDDGRLVVDRLNWDINTEGIFRIACDNQNNIWALKRDVGLFKIRNDKSKLISEISTNEFYIYDMRIINGILYIVTTSNDIYRYDSDTEKISKLNTQPISKASIRHLIDYGNNSLLACTDGNGFRRIDLETGAVSDFYLNIPLLSSNHLKIHKVIRDRNENMWIGLYQKGVAVISATSNAFGYIGYKSLLNNIIGNSTASAICKDHNGNVWVGTDGDGIYRMNTDGTESKHYPSYTDGGSVPSIIKTAFADSENNVWFGTYGNGIGKISLKDDKYVSYESTFSRKGTAVTRIYDIIEDNDKRLWVASLGSGMFCYDLKTNKMIDKLSFSDEINKWQTCLLHTSNNELYVGTFDGLYHIDLNRETITPRQIFNRRAINTLYEDSQGRLWAGDNNGLIRFDNAGIVESFSSNKGLPQVSVNSINEGIGNSLWLATDKGLINYNPFNESCFRYTTNEGLQNMEFAKTHSFSDNQSRIWFAGDNGVTFFNPQDLNVIENQRHVRVIDFYINNEHITTNTLSHNKPIISEPAYIANTFRLNQANSSFVVEFGTYELDTPKFVEYMYSLDGDDWVSINSGTQRAVFNNLSTGNHSIRYKLVDNLVESDIQEIQVIIEPYWWLSRPALIIYILLIIGGVLYIAQQIRYTFLSQKRHNRQQRAIEINEAKLQFFTNISHDIKTPLSLIMSPLQKLIATDHDPKRQGTYNTIFRNAKMLQQLINQLLDLRKIDNGRLKLTFHNRDLVVMIKDLCSYFDIVSEEKNMRFSFVHEAETMEAWIDPVYFDKIIMNLLSNAFKYTPNNGNIEISLHEKIKDNDQRVAEITVRDNGIGIKEEDLEHIFDRFFMGKENYDSVSSNGIGLHLTRSLVGLHHGTIEAKNNADSPGVSFVVELPLGREHFRDDETLIEKEEEALIQNDETEYLVALETESANNKTLSTKTLLIVDDDPEILNYLRTELSSDFHIETCNNGKDALDLIFRKQPDIIISDVMMPEMDGITFCKKIKQNVNFNHIPVILLTAKSDEVTNLQGLKYGADAYMTKPFYIEILRRTALNLVNLRSQLQNIYTGQQTQEERQVKIEMESPNQKLLDRIMRVVNANISNTDLSIDMLCDEVGISRAHIYRKLKELTNQSGRDFIKNIRLKYAENLLLEDKYSIGEIAEKVGFSKASNFSNAFKEKYGLPPFQWREAQKKKTE